LERHHDNGSRLLAADIPRTAYLALLRAKHAIGSGDQPAGAPAALEAADRALPEPGDPPGSPRRRWRSWPNASPTV
jgi:hypothetical protein